MRNRGRWRWRGGTEQARMALSPAIDFKGMVGMQPALCHKGAPENAGASHVGHLHALLRQALYKLHEEQALVRIRKVDEPLMEGVIRDATAAYAKQYGVAAPEVRAGVGRVGEIARKT